MARVLIVDDEASIRLLYRMELEDAGFEVESLGEGRAVPDAIRSFRPDVLVLDLKMMDMSGADVVEEVRREHPELPIIFCSAYPKGDALAKRHQDVRFVAKSSDPSELVDAVTDALRG